MVVEAAHSVGKTRGLSRLVISWVLTHPVGDALVVITSDNDDNIKGGIWQDVIAAHEKAAEEGRPLPGKVTLGRQMGTQGRTTRRLSPSVGSHRTATRPVCRVSTAST